MQTFKYAMLRKERLMEEIWQITNSTRITARITLMLRMSRPGFWQVTRGIRKMIILMCWGWSLTSQSLKFKPSLCLVTQCRANLMQRKHTASKLPRLYRSCPLLTTLLTLVLNLMQIRFTDTPGIMEWTWQRLILTILNLTTQDPTHRRLLKKRPQTMFLKKTLLFLFMR